MAGRLTIIGFSGVGSQTSPTASTISLAYESSVPVYDSGEYWKRQSVPGRFSASSRTFFAPSTAIFVMPSRSERKTTRRCRIEVEL